MPSLCLGLAFVPVLLFLTALVFLDSFKLVTPGSTIRSILVGGLAALLALAVNTFLESALGLDPASLRRVAGPIVEEVVKSAFLVFLIRTRRVGFIVDAAIHGFALGAGFALVENVYYLAALRDWTLLLWLIRGFGTAMVHGSTMAIFGMVSKALADRRARPELWVFLPGLAVAILIHAGFNLLLLPPLAATALLLAVMPLLVIFAFERSEKATHEWLGVNLDTEVALLETINTGEFRDSKVGRYLHSLTTRVPGAVVGDMLCLLRIHLELSIRAKGVLIARAAGMDVPVDDEVRANLEEIRFLERAIGRAGRLAMHPILTLSSRDLWQIYMLQKKSR